MQPENCFVKGNKRMALHSELISEKYAKLFGVTMDYRGIYAKSTRNFSFPMRQSGGAEGPAAHSLMHSSQCTQILTRARKRASPTHTISRQLRLYLQQVVAPQTMHEAASTGTRSVSEAIAFERELTKERVMNNYLQCKIFNEKHHI